MATRTIFIRAAFVLPLLCFSLTHEVTTQAFANEPFDFVSQDHTSFGNPQSANFVQVKKLSFPIQLADKTNQQMVGFLYYAPRNFKGCLTHRSFPRLLHCIKDRSLKNRTLQVLVHGFTYNHTYWDPPITQLSHFSYAKYMAQQGYPVLALDLLGTGESSTPDGDALNITESVSSLAQVLTAVRSLPNPLRRDFKQVVLVGHSVGTAIAVTTAGTFPAIADFLITTGWSFSPHVVPLSQELIAASLATPYIRFPDPVREELFYFAPTAKQSVIAFDNRVLADQFSRGVLVEGLPLLQALALGDIQTIQDISRIDRVNVPVLIQLGRFDVIAPPLMPEVDARLFASSPDVTVEILERMGHSFNFHRNRLNSWRGIDQWIEKRLKKWQKP